MGKIRVKSFTTKLSLFYVFLPLEELAKLSSWPSIIEWSSSNQKNFPLKFDSKKKKRKTWKNPFSFCSGHWIMSHFLLFRLNCLFHRKASLVRFNWIILVSKCKLVTLLHVSHILTRQQVTSSSYQRQTHCYLNVPLIPDIDASIISVPSSSSSQ